MTRQEVYYRLGLPLIRNHSIITYQKGKSEMLKSISFKKLAVLSAGIAIVLSSCGLQNSASESSGTETAAGKTKNFSLSAGGNCWDDVEQWAEASRVFFAKWMPDAPADLNWDRVNMVLTSDQDPDYAARMTVEGRQTMPTNDPNFYADISNGVPCPAGVTSAGETDVPSAIVCVKPAIKQAMVDGFSEQLARPLGGEVTEQYLATMQKGLDVSNALCTN